MILGTVRIMAIMTPKMTHKALFSGGTFVDVTEGTIDQVFLRGVDTPHRRRLTSQLRLFIAYLRSLGLTSFELWIDGSFTTVNPDPMDIDVVCYLPRDQLAQMSDENLEALAFLASKNGRAYVRERWSIDYYHCPFDALEERNYWKKKYSSDENGMQKGIGRIKI